MLLHGYAGVPKLLAIHQINIRTITRVFKLVCLLLDILNQVAVEIRRPTKFELLYFGSKKFGDLIICFFQIIGC